MKPLRKNKRIFNDIAATAGIFGMYAVLEGMGITCPILFLTGVSCAGCGMSRAWLALLRGDAAAAFSYHPLFWAVPAAFLGRLFSDKLSDRLLSFLKWGGCFLFLAVYFLRLADPQDNIVIFSPENGLIFRALCAIKNLRTGFVHIS